MLIIIVLAFCIAVTGAVTFIILCLGIRRDDRSARLDCQAAGLAAPLARRFTGLRTERPDPADPRNASGTRERAGADA